MIAAPRAQRTASVTKNRLRSFAAARIFSAALVALLVVAGCSAPAASTTPAATTTPASAPTTASAASPVVGVPSPSAATASAGLPAAITTLLDAAPANKNPVELLNVSYDPTRELYSKYNAAFAKFWQEKNGQTVTVKQSHGGSGSQARSVIDGLEADVVTLALAYDVDSIRTNGKQVTDGWLDRLPNNSAPYTSTIVFLVRKGNPKGIKEWADLARPGVSVITPNPKTSGGARWNYLAAWGSVTKAGGTPEAAKELVKGIFKNVAVLDSGARGSTTTFVERGIGDVLISWENEAYLAVNELGKDKFDIVNPSISILAEPSVSLVDRVVDKKGTRTVANAYLAYLYTPEGQRIAAQNYYRPRTQSVFQEFASQFPSINLLTIDDFGGWDKAQKDHFSDGGTFDQIYQP